MKLPYDMSMHGMRLQDYGIKHNAKVAKALPPAVDYSPCDRHYRSH